MKHASLKIAVLLILFGVLMRVVPHEPNFAPISAIALLSGAYLGKKYALFVPLAIMFISDIFLGFYGSMAFTWLAFALIAVYGMLFKNAGFMPRVVFGGIGSSLLFFVVSNFGVWIVGGLYPPTLAGLVNCYYMALPFLRATFLSDVMYSAVFFGIAAIAVWSYRTVGYRRAIAQ